ncbi:MAG: leucine-rich repeat protein, partial [Kiritimatiellae bacterium]|nr:leucine-rich repeat protein [Kiritimatiellia bacterium]
MNLRKYTLAAATLAALALIVPAASAVSVTLKWNLSQIRDEDGNRPSAGQFVGYFVPVFDTSGTLATLEDLYGSGDPRGEFAWRLQEVGVSELSVSELLGCYGAAFTTGALGAMSGSFVEEFSGAATISAVVVVFNAPDVESATSFFVTANTIENTIDPSRPISATSFNFGSQAGAQWLRIEYHDDEPEVELHTVTFDLNGHGARTGGGELTQTVTNGCFAVAPEVMAADGWEFAGWEPDVAAAITNDTTFVAQYRALPYWEGSETIDGVTWRFAVTNGFATITGGTNGLAAAEGASGHVQIPESLGGCAVRAIGDRAFKGNINITEVVLHGMVASIGTEAFRGCSGLERATIPAGGLTEIRTRAFQDCASLTSISLPEGIEAVAAYSLMATDIEGADIPEGVVSIGGYAFAYCESLRWVRLPSTLASIGDHAFYGCTALASIDLPDSVSEIGSNAFGYCGALARVTFAGDAPASVSAYAFTDACTNCAAYVSRGSTGWGVEIPGTWKGIRIEYIDDEPAAGVTVAVTEVRQRWPWNGFVDIDCTVTCADAAADVLLSVTARDASTGTDLPVRSVRLENGAFGGELRVRAGDLAGGQVRLIWDAGADLPETVVESAQVEVTATVAAPDAEHEGVQLWEDGPYWATTNIGAEEPWESGLYFWWGDTVGYRREGDAWVASDGSSQNFSFSGGNTPTYGKSVETLQSEGWTTSDGVLAPAHDAAHVQCGGNWRMPTKDELSALGNTNNCNWAWTTTNGVNGYVVSGRGDYASASIFLPAASDGYGTSIRNAGSSGNYWSSVPHSSGSLSSWGLYFYYSGYHDTYSNYRIYGRSVRPVQGFAEAAVPAAASVCADVSAPFRLDTAEGARTMSEGEALPITYSPRWGGAATCSVADNGATLLSGATEEDVLSWTPSSGGRHVLTHIAGTNTLEAVFLVDSMPFDFDTDAVEMAILGGEWDVNSLSMTIELQMNPCSEGGVERFISDVERGALMWSVPGKKVLWDDWCYVAEGMLYGEGVEITASNTVVFRVPLQSDDLQFRFLKIYLEDERSSSRIESSNIVKLTSMANQEGEIVRTVTVGTTPSDFAVPTRVVDFNDFLINHYLGNGEPLVVSCGDRVRFSYDLRELCDYGLGGSDYVTPFIIGEDATCAYGIENDWSDDWEEYGRQFSDRVPNVGFFDLLVWESPGRYALILLPDWDEWWIDDDFSGWWNSLDQMIEEVQREDGVFTIIEVDVVEQSATPTVTFDLGEHGVRTGGGELVQTVTNGCYAVAPTVAANEESAGWWRFDGWDKDFSAVTSDLTVNAVWTPTVPNDFVLTTTIDCEPDERPFVTWTVSHSIPMEWMNYLVVNILAKTSEDGAWVDASDIPDILSDENAFAYVKVVFTFRDDVTTEDGTPVESIESANVVAIPRP